MTPFLTWPLIALAFGLAMDAFAVSVAQGASRRAEMRTALAMGAAFGLAQGLMPLLGWGLGWALAGVIRSVDHWIAFVLLGLLGAKMLREGLSKEPNSDGATAAPALIGWTLLGAAIATSIDAAAAGITLPMLGTPILASCLVIGVITGALCVAGVLIGAASGARLGKIAEVIGGLVLIGIGTKVLIEHLFFGG